MIDNDFMESLKRARTYGLGEFLEIIGELSQESTKKGILDRKHKELITLGMALAKGCHRCIDIHTEAALKLGATDTEMLQVRRVALYVQASPEDHHTVANSPIGARVGKICSYSMKMCSKRSNPL
jgi:AhpD family alkylhydroperoxidase